MHGGLFSTDTVTLDDIRQVDRNKQPPDTGVCSLSFPLPPSLLSSRYHVRVAVVRPSDAGAFQLIN